MLKNQYISWVLLMMLLVTFVNVYYKPHLPDRGQWREWLHPGAAHPIARSACALQGLRCPSDELCDCETYCQNGQDYVSFRVAEGDRVYVMDRQLAPGTYCLPKGIGNCNLQTSYHVYSMAGWSCIGVNDDIFRRDKKRACKNEEARDDGLNVLYDYQENREVEGAVDDYYERLPSGDLRYRCRCGSRALDGTPMVSVFPFVCLVDYCLRDIPNPIPSMGWDGQKCACGPYRHLDPNDPTSACRREISQIENGVLTGRVECMTRDSFVKHALVCPTEDGTVVFKTELMDGTNPRTFVSTLLSNNVI